MTKINNIIWIQLVAQANIIWYVSLIHALVDNRKDSVIKIDVQL